MIKNINCPYSEFMEKSDKENIPIRCIFELTFRCNLRCYHCYNNEFESQPLTTKEIKHILDQLADNGTFFIIFTGGEIFMREDIFNILEYANHKKFIMSLFTNGTLLNEEKAKRLAGYNIISLEVSIYAPYASLHDKITRTSGSFQKSVNAIRLLRKQEIRVALKVSLFKDNIKTYAEIKKFADSNGVKCTFSHVISPMRDGNTKNMNVRISAKNFSKYLPDIYREALSFFAQDDSIPFEDKLELPVCSAARNTFAIDPYGELFPCLLAPEAAGSLCKDSFRDLWRSSNVLRQWRDLRYKDISGCNECKFLLKCPICPVDQLLENGSLGPIKEICDSTYILYKEAIKHKYYTRRLKEKTLDNVFKTGGK